MVRKVYGTSRGVCQSLLNIFLGVGEEKRKHKPEWLISGTKFKFGNPRKEAGLLIHRSKS